MSDDDRIAVDPTLPLRDGAHGSVAATESGLITGSSGLIADRYEVLALLGVGGMGHVYRVRDVQLGEVVALKTLNDELSQSLDAIDRFRAEVKLARRVTHPNVARTYDIGQFNGHYFLTMEFIEGETLEDRMHRKPALNLGEAFSILIDVARGLEAAHRVGVIHRDLKPANVLLGEEGRVAISDFGIARALEASGDATGRVLLGTPAYMAPEQVQGTEIDGRADQFALGVILFELLSGRLPWSAPTPLATALQRVVDPPPDLSELRPDLPAPLRDAVLRSLAVDPDERFADASAWIAAMEGFTGLDTESEVSVAEETTTSSGFTARTPRETASERTVAVIPFRIRGEGDGGHLADGLTEEIIDELSMSAALKVRPRGSLATLDVDSLDPQTLGRELGVQVIVQGSIHMRGDRLRVRVALISVEDGFQIWANRFEGTAADLFDMSIDVAEAVSAALLVERPGVARPQRSDSAAIDLYMRARQEMQLAWHGDMAPAIELFESALELAPSAPRILAGAATAYARAAWLRPMEREHYLERAETAAKEAIAQFERSPEAHLALSAVHRFRGDRGSSLKLAREVLDLAPGYVDAQFMVGQTLLETGPLDRAIAYLEAARRSAPDLPHIRIELARARALQGEWDEVDQLLSLPPALQGTSGGVFEVTRTRLDLWRDGPAQWAEEPVREAPGHASVEPVTRVLRALKRGEEIDMASDAWIEQARSGEGRPDWFIAVMHQIIAEMFAFRGDVDDAMQHIEAAARLGSSDVVWLTHCPLFDDLRGNRRFAEHVVEFEARANAISSVSESSKVGVT